MTDYTAKIRAKGLDSTGVTEEIAQAMYNSPGRFTMAIVELKHVRQIHDADGDRQVELIINQIEPSTSPDLDAHLRNLTRTMHQNRALHSVDQQLQIETSDDLEPTIEQVIAAGEQHVAETDDQLPDPDDPDAEPQRPNPAWEPHGYVDTPYGTCGYPDCGAAMGDKVHDDVTTTNVTPIGKSPFVTT